MWRARARRADAPTRGRDRRALEVSAVGEPERNLPQADRADLQLADPRPRRRGAGADGVVARGARDGERLRRARGQGGAPEGRPAGDDLRGRRDDSNQRRRTEHREYPPTHAAVLPLKTYTSPALE